MEFNFNGLNRQKPKAEMSDDEQIRQRIEKMRESGFDNPETGESKLNDSVASCGDFRTLYNLIANYEGWKFSNGDPLDNKHLREILTDVQNGRMGLEYVTSRYGLRNKVSELLEKQNVVDNAYIIKQPEIESSEPKDNEPESVAYPTEDLSSFHIESREIDINSPEAQANLAKEYLAAYAEYKSISERSTNELRILDKLIEEGQSSTEAINKQRDVFSELVASGKIAMDKYVAIGKKLTSESVETYLG